MVKLRNKDSRPKKINDFKKIKAKVGKKIKRGPTTIINVKAKRINVPHQQSILNETINDESIKISKLIKQFHHHSSSNRSSALDELQEILNNSSHAGSHIALAIPSAMELLFDEETETRKKLRDMITSVLHQHPMKSYYMAIASVLSTYICSGLTSLNKAIRRDSLRMALCFLQTDAGTVFTNDVDKLMRHVLSLLSEPSLCNQVTSSGAKETTTTPRTKSGAHSKRSKPSQQQYSMLTSAVLVLEKLLHLLPVDIPSSTYPVATEILESFPVKVVQMRPSFRRSPLIGRTPANASYCSGESLLDSCCVCLQGLWKGLVLDCTGLRTDIPELVLSSSTVLRICTRLAGMYSKPSPFLCGLLQGLWSGFPYASPQAEVAPAGSAAEAAALHHAEDVNTLVCLTVLSSPYSLDYGSGPTEYVHQTLSSLSGRSVEMTESIGRLLQCATLLCTGSSESLVSVLEELGRLLRSLTDTRTSMGLIRAVTASLHRVVHTESLWEPGEVNSEALILVVETISSLPGRLVESRREGMGPVLDLCARVVLLATKRISALCNGQSDQWVNTLCQNVRGVFLPCQESLDTVYGHSTPEVRRLWLDVFFHTPFGDSLPTVSQEALECLAEESSEEQCYLISILFSRRMELDPHDFVDLLMDHIELTVIALRDEGESSLNSENLGVSDELDTTLVDICSVVMSPQWVGHYIATTLHTCAPSANSLSVLSMVIPRLEGLLNEEPEDGMKGLDCYARAMATLVCVRRLIAPWEVPRNRYFTPGQVNVNSLASQESEEVLKKAIEVAATACAVLLFDCISSSLTPRIVTTSVQQLMTGEYERCILRPVVEMLSIHWEWSSSDGSDQTIYFIDSVVGALDASLDQSSSGNVQMLSWMNACIHYWQHTDNLSQKKKFSLKHFLESSGKKLNGTSKNSCDEYIKDILSYLI